MTAVLRSRLPFVVAAALALGSLLGLTTAPAYASSTYTATVCIQDSGGNPLAPATTRYQLNGGPIAYFSSTVDANQCLTQDFAVSGAANLTVWTSYNNTTSDHVTQDLATDPSFVFHTSRVTVRVQDPDGNGVAGASVRYRVGSTYWYPGQPTGPSGELAAEMFPGTYDFIAGLNQTEKTITQDVGADPLVQFTTTPVTIGYSGSVGYGGATGDTAFFKPAGSSPATRQMFPGTVMYRFDHPGGPTRLPLTISDGTPLVESMIVARLLDLGGSPVSGVAVGSDAGPLGTTNANGVAYLLADGLLGSVGVSLSYDGPGPLTITQDQPTSSIYVFQPGAVTRGGVGGEIDYAPDGGAQAPMTTDPLLLWPGGYYFTVAATDQVRHCTVAAGHTYDLSTNACADATPTLVVIDHVVNDDGGTASAGDFTVTVAGGNPLPAGSFAGSEAGTAVHLLHDAAYAVHVTGPAGYTNTLSADCSGSLAYGETKTCTITSDDTSLRATKQEVLDDLVALRADTSNLLDRLRLDAAIVSLKVALAPALWAGPDTLKPFGGVPVFVAEKVAILALEQLQDAKHSSVPDATAQGFIDRLVLVDTQLAEVAIAQATAAGGDAGPLAQAGKELAKAQSEIAAGQYAPALDHLKNAWMKAIQSTR